MDVKGLERSFIQRLEKLKHFSNLKEDKKLLSILGINETELLKREDLENRKTF